MENTMATTTKSKKNRYGKYQCVADGEKNFFAKRGMKNAIGNKCRSSNNAMFVDNNLSNTSDE